MRTFAKYLALLLPFALLATSCARPESTLGEKLAKVWESSADSTKALTFTLDDTKAGGRFDYQLQSQPLQGDWIIVDSTITLVFDAKNLTAVVDSSFLEIQNNSAELVLLSEGQEISRIKDNELLLPKDTVKLAVTNVNFNALQLRDQARNQTIDLVYEPEVMKGGMSVTGVLRGLLGMLVLIAIAWLASANRKAISWSLVGKGLLTQFIFALLILKVPFIESGFEVVSNFFLQVINFASDGTKFLFASFGAGEIEGPLMTFAVTVLPTIIFFSALTSLMYYLGVLQKIVWAFAWVMKRIMNLSGAESLAAAGNIFLGQTETPLLIRPYLDKMTKSEIMTLMTGGMATIAGGVLAAYIGFLGGDDPAEQLFFAKHLLAASVMSAPAAIVAAKIIIPETESFNQELKVSKDKIGTNALEAIANGTTDGLKLAVNVAAMLLVFIALMAMGNAFLGWAGDMTGLNGVIAEHTAYSSLSFEFILGYVGAPIAWCMGVPWEDAVLVGQLLGEKTIVNEFIAYKSLGEMKAAGAFTYEKSIVMSTYVLCGFANFASIGIQIGGIGALIPSRKGLLSQLGIRALIGGTLACLFTAVVVGMFL